MRFFKALALILLFAVAMLFFVQNMQTLGAEVSLILNLFVVQWKSVPFPLYWMVLLPFTAGAVMMILYFGFEKLRLSQDLRAAKTQVAQLEKELAALKPQPAVEAPVEAEADTCCQQAQ